MRSKDGTPVRVRIDLLCALPDHKLRSMSLRLAMQQIESNEEPYGGMTETK